MASGAFICRREKWNYNNKVKWSSNGLASVRLYLPLSSSFTLFLSFSLSISLSSPAFYTIFSPSVTTFPPQQVNFKVPLLIFVFRNFLPCPATLRFQYPCEKNVYILLQVRSTYLSLIYSRVHNFFVNDKYKMQNSAIFYLTFINYQQYIFWR